MKGFIMNDFVEILKFILTLAHVWAPYVIIIGSIFGIGALLMASRSK